MAKVGGTTGPRIIRATRRVLVSRPDLVWGVVRTIAEVTRCGRLWNITHGTLAIAQGGGTGKVSRRGERDYNCENDSDANTEGAADEAQNLGGFVSRLTREAEAPKPNRKAAKATPKND